MTAVGNCLLILDGNRFRNVDKVVWIIRNIFEGVTP